MHTTRTEAVGRLRLLAIRAAELDGGRVANRLSAYALLIEERPTMRKTMLAELDISARLTSNPALAELLDEACDVMRDLPAPAGWDANGRSSTLSRMAEAAAGWR